MGTKILFTNQTTNASSASFTTLRDNVNINDSTPTIEIIGVKDTAAITVEFQGQDSNWYTTGASDNSLIDTDVPGIVILPFVPEVVLRLTITNAGASTDISARVHKAKFI